MKTYIVKNDIEEVQIQAEGSSVFHIYPKVVEVSPNFLWNNIQIIEI